MSRRARLAVAAVVVAAVVLPMARPGTPDSFPLSTFPMFSTDRPAVVSVATAVGVEPDGRRRRLSPEVISGTYEVVLAGATVARAVGGGRASAERLCDEIAGRADPQRVRTVEVVTETLDAVDVVRHDADPLEVVVHARCRVGGS